MSLLDRIREAAESRAGLPSSLSRSVDVAMPGGANPRHIFGAVLVALFIVEALTGVAMMTVYAPNPTSAWASTYYLQFVLPWGAMVRAMHHWASHGLVVGIAAHMLQTVASGAHRAPRELNWWLGLALAAMVLGAAMTGFPLAWDQKGYWVSRVETGIMGTLPVMGPAVQRFVLGGAQYGALTLTRFYTLHVAVIPAAFVAILGAHAALVRRHGIRGGEGASSDARWWPSQAAIDTVAMLVTVALVAWLAKSKGVVLDAPADPQSQYPARPEWYFMPLSQLLHHFQGSKQIIGTAVIPGVLTGYLATLPWLDGPSRKGVARIVVLAPLAIFAAGAFWLGWELTSHDAHDRDLAKANVIVHRQARRAVELARMGVPPEGPLEMMRNDPAVRPAALFKQNCGTCHAVRDMSTQRKGPRLDGFGSRAWAAAFVAFPDHPELMATTTIHDMPPQRRLSDDELRAVSEWLYSQGVERGEPAADPALLATATPIIRERCNGCHLGSLTPSDTEGMTRDAPSLDGWGSREWIYDQIMIPHRMEQYGARNHMTRFRDKLSDREAQMIVDYTRSLRTRPAPATIRPPRPQPAPEAPAPTP